MSKYLPKPDPNGYSVEVRPAGRWRWRLTLYRRGYLSTEVPRVRWGSRARAKEHAQRWVRREQWNDAAARHLGGQL